MKKKNVGADSISAQKKNKGITLIALIITIIVMLILVAVSISIALNTGLFDAAGKATQKTNIAKEQEKELASGKVTIGNKPYNSIEDYVNKDKEIDVAPKIGDYVNYEPTPDTYQVTTDESGHSEVQNFATQTGENALKWRIMSLGDEDGNILLVADRVTNDVLTLKGEDSGWANGPELIDEFCSTLYDNPSLGATARSYNVFSEILSGVGYGDGSGRTGLLAKPFGIKWRSISFFT